MGLFSSILGLKDAPAARTVSAEEKAALKAQTASLEKLSDIATQQLNLSDAQIEKYTKAFEDPNNLANEDLAEFQSLITGNPVSTRDLEGKSIEDIIRETMLQSSGEFKRQAEDYISKTDTLSKDFGLKTQLNTDKLVSSLEQSGYEYQTDLASTKANVGKIDQDILAQETGAATAGISTAFSEAQKGLESNLARRGLAGSGLDAQATAQLAQQEALAKYGAQSQARAQARGISDQIRMQQMGISGQQYQAGMQTAQGIYGAQTQGMGTAYQAGMNQAGGALQAGTTGTQQGLQTLGQVQAIGQQQYGLGAQMLGSAAGSFTQAGAGYGGVASQQIQQSTQQHQMATQAAASHNAAIGSLVGTGIGAVGGYYFGAAKPTKP